MFWISLRSVSAGGFGNDPRNSSLYLSFDGGAPPTPNDKRGRGDWVDEVLAAAGRTKNIVFFVHGYNNSVDDVWRTHRALETQLAAKGFDCTVISFDWPSGQIMTAYLPDMQDAKTTAMALVRDGIQLFDRVSRPDCDVATHVVAHSMGAFVVQSAFDDADHSRLGGSNWAVGQVVLLAGDVSSPSMTATSDRSVSLYRHVNRLTNYFSGSDEALQISNVKRFGLGPRVGRVGLPPEAPANALDIDCTRRFAEQKATLEPIVPANACLSHSWYFYDDTVMGDVAATLAGKIDRYAIPGRVRVGDNDFRLD